MEPDSEDTRTILEPEGRRFARDREWTRKGGEMADVAREKENQYNELK